MIVEVRGRPGVVVPGKVKTKSNASREVKGSSVICRPMIVVAMLAVCAGHDG
jgi:hypothetical protein